MKPPVRDSGWGLFPFRGLTIPFAGNAVDAAWLAGIIDGEGSINAYFREPRRGGQIVGIQLQIVNTDMEIINRVLAICTEAKFTTVIRGGVRKPIHHVWMSRRSQLISVLSAVQPYLTGKKRRRAELALEYMESRSRWGSGHGHQHTRDELDLLVAIKETK